MTVLEKGCMSKKHAYTKTMAKNNSGKNHKREKATAKMADN
jgi:hypothetical protein